MKPKEAFAGFNILNGTVINNSTTNSNKKCRL